MLTQIHGVLDQQQLQIVQKLASQGRFTDGSTSAGKAAKRVKHNEELSLESTRFGELNNLVMGSLVKHPVYRSAAMPLKIATPYYARYTAGMSYGDHVDDPIMGQGDIYRSDVSITIFLNNPDKYTGGELVIQTSFGEQLVKLAAGDAIIYPSSSRHRVAEVTQGERWSQSAGYRAWFATRKNAPCCMN